MNTRSNYIIFGVIVVCSLIYALFFRSPSGSDLDFSTDSLTISGEGYSYTLSYDDISEITLVESPDYGTEVSGGSNDTVTYGTWENAVWGTYSRCTYNSVSCAIAVTEANGAVTVFTDGTDRDTQDMCTGFEELLEEYRAAN